MATRWPVPGPADDKYTQGVTGIAAGSATYPGAAVLASGAAVLATSGMVRYSGSAADLVRARWPEVVATDEFADAARTQSWAVGPGIGTDDAGRALLAAVLDRDVPVCIDADGVTLLGGHADLRSAIAGRPVVLTPHDREFARVAGEVGPDRIAAARRAAAALRVTVLLKGNATVVADPDGRTLVHPSTTSWAATAGSGDVLTGIVGALLAAGLDPWWAAGCGAFVHARAAEIAADGAPVPSSAIQAGDPGGDPVDPRLGLTAGDVEPDDMDANRSAEEPNGMHPYGSTSARSAVRCSDSPHADAPLERMEGWTHGRSPFRGGSPRGPRRGGGRPRRGATQRRGARRRRARRRADGRREGRRVRARRRPGRPRRPRRGCDLARGLHARRGARAARRRASTAPVLSWLHLPDEDFAPAVAAGIDLSVASRAHLAAVADGARRAGRPARVHLKVDTGLSRGGAVAGRLAGPARRRREGRVPTASARSWPCGRTSRTPTSRTTRCSTSRPRGSRWRGGRPSTGVSRRSGTSPTPRPP